MQGTPGSEDHAGRDHVGYIVAAGPPICGGARPRTELDGLVANFYGLTESECAHILTTFPLVPAPVKVDAISAYRATAPGLPAA